MSEDLEHRIKELEDRVSVLEDAVVAPSRARSKTKRQSPREFLLVVSPKSIVEKTLSLAYYHEVITDKGAFNTNDLEILFRAAKEKPPTNIGDMITKNARKGYIMEDAVKKDDKKAWVLTVTGEKYVEGNLLKEE